MALRQSMLVSILLLPIVGCVDVGAIEGEPVDLEVVETADAGDTPVDGATPGGDPIASDAGHGAEEGAPPVASDPDAGSPPASPPAGGPPPPSPTCGDGSCAAPESCSSCPADCGACPTDADVLTKCTSSPMQWWAKPNRDLTFVAFGDTQAQDPTAGCDHFDGYDPAQNTKLRDALNSLGAHVWPSGAPFTRAGKPFDRIRGAIVVGDLTQAGNEAHPMSAVACHEYAAYRAVFGRCGTEGKLAYPLYEGYGNHDFPYLPGSGDASYHPVVDLLDRITADHRPGDPADVFDDPVAGTAHYAWRWDDVWFVHLNLMAGSVDEPIVDEGATRITAPHGALRFLEAFLKSRSPSTSRQIVVLTHYGMNSGRVSPSEKVAFCRILDEARKGTGSFGAQRLASANPVLGNIHGHTHNPADTAPWVCPDPFGAISFPRFDAGTPFLEDPKNSGSLHFSVFRIGNSNLEAVGVRASKDAPTGPWAYTYQQRFPGVTAP